MGWAVDVRAGRWMYGRLYRLGGGCTGWQVDVRAGRWMYGLGGGQTPVRNRSRSQAVPVHRRFRFVRVPVDSRFRFGTVLVRRRFWFANGSGLQCVDPGHGSARFGSLDGSVWRFLFGSWAS